MIAKIVSGTPKVHSTSNNNSNAGTASIPHTTASKTFVALDLDVTDGWLGP